MPTYDNDSTYSSIVIDSVISAVTLVIALAWNKAIKELVDKIKHIDTYGALIYAISITIIGVSAIRVLLILNKKIGNSK